MERHEGAMSDEDAEIVRTSRKIMVKDIRCTECGSFVYALRDAAGRPRLVEIPIAVRSGPSRFLLDPPPAISREFLETLVRVVVGSSYEPMRLHSVAGCSQGKEAEHPRIDTLEARWRVPLEMYDLPWQGLLPPTCLASLLPPHSSALQAVLVHLHRVIDHEFRGRQRIDLLRITTVTGPQYQLTLLLRVLAKRRVRGSLQHRRSGGPLQGKQRSSSRRMLFWSLIMALQP